MVVILGIVGVTGFLAPGFFLSGDEDQRAVAGGTERIAPTKRPQTSPGERLVFRIAEGLNRKDTAALKKVACPKRRSTVDRTIDIVPEIRSATLFRILKHNDHFVVASMRLSTAQDRTVLKVHVEEQGGTVCWDAVTFEGPSPLKPPQPSKTSEPDERWQGGVPPAADQFMKRVVRKINDRDQSVLRLECPSIIGGGLAKLLDDDAKLTLGQVTQASPAHATRLVRGTLGGKPADGALMVSRLSVNGKTWWCVFHLFFD